MQYLQYAIGSTDSDIWNIYGSPDPAWPRAPKSGGSADPADPVVPTPLQLGLAWSIQDRFECTWSSAGGPGVDLFDQEGSGRLWVVQGASRVMGDGDEYLEWLG